MKLTAALYIFLFTFSFAQVSETFSDGDFTNNPAWIGSVTEFTVNGALEAQTQNSVASTSYLSTGLSFNSGVTFEWQVRVKITTAPSSSNFARFWLLADNTDLQLANGYFLQFGESGSTDAVRLKKLVGGVETEICAGPVGQIASSFNVRVRVLRTSSGNWTLFVDPAGGTAFNQVGTGSDSSITSGTNLGFLATYTASNATKYYFDDVYAGLEIIDSQAPQLVSVVANNATSFDVLFSEAISGSGVANPSNYSLNPTVAITAAIQDGSNPALVHLSLASPLMNGATYNLTVGTISDLSGNTASGLQGAFTYLVSESPVKGDVIITEFMCDPSPPLGLPELEFVEIYNRSNKYFDLAGWKLGDASANGTISSGWIAPGEYKILCATASQVSFPGSYAVSSFPSLNNAGDDIVLLTPGLVMIDKLTYTDEWYRDDVKADGGYSIELINPNDPCSDASNWRGSDSPDGGTPGSQNSVYDVSPDTSVPSIISTSAGMPNFALVTFSEGIDSLSVANSVFMSNPSLTLTNISVSAEGTDHALLTFAQALVPSQIYTFTLGAIADCWMNSANLTSKFALAELPSTGDLIINEILFDPGTGGSDFVEVYNRSSKLINLKNSYFASISADTIGNIKTITADALIPPYGYAVFSSDTNWVRSQFSESVPGTFHKQSLPSLNNDSSTVMLFTEEGHLLDKVAYRDEWHLSFIDDTENKTLERIDPNGNSNSSDNWHTAAESIDFGTPGRVNSQFSPGGVNGEFGTLTPVFSPDNDGFQDVIQFYYQMPEAGMIATVSIFDSYGNPVRSLKKSELLGISGNFSWDGVNESQQKSVFGVYIAVIECFSQSGDAKFSKRLAFTLAGKLE